MNVKIIESPLNISLRLFFCHVITIIIEFSNEPSAKKEDLICEALYNYDKTRDDELQLYKGQKILILEESEDDWWRGRNLENGQDGWFPSNYVELVSNYS